MPYEFEPGSMYRMPTHFGPSLGPRQGPGNRRYANADSPKKTIYSVSFPEARAGLLLAVGAATGITVRVGAGWVADRRNTGSLWGIALLLGIGTLGYVLLSTGQAVLLYAGAVLAFGGALGWSGLLAHGVVSRNLAKPARATGIIQIGFYTGGGLGPPVFGRLIDTYSYATAWRAAAVAALVAGLLAVVVELRTNTMEP